MAQVADEFDYFCRVRVDALVPADQPPVLISQLPRSGGTLLMRLFDGHPECHSFPHEHGGGFGRLGKELPSSATEEEAWGTLHNPELTGWFRKGYPITQRKNSDEKTRIRMPLLVSPTLQKRIFWATYPKPFDERGAYSAYNTSYFNAWTDNQNLYGPAKKWVVHFQPRVIFSANAGSRYVDRFFSLYPDGRIISIVREPKSWFPSAQGWAVKETSKRPSQTEKPKVVAAMDAWTSGVRDLLQIREENRDRMAIVRFDDLLAETPGTMRALSGWLGIGNSRELRSPTFNGLPAAPNTSFEIKTTGVVKDPLRRAEGLADEDRRQIELLSGDLMDQVAESCLRPARKRAEKGRVGKAVAP